MSEFRAKDIQRIVGLTKSRYEYLAIKIGISPEVQEVEGTGRSHLYSFKNLLQFAYAHHAGDLGLSPKATKRMLFILTLFNYRMIQISRQVEQLTEAGVKVDYLMHQNSDRGTLFYPVISGDPEAYGHFSSDSDTSFELNYIKKSNCSMFQLTRLFSKGGGQTYYTDENDKVLFKEFHGTDFKFKEANLKDAIGFITLNIGNIKERILKRTRS